jgi:ComF family protein
VAAAFDYEGPAASLVKGLKYGSLDYLAIGMGAFMAAQYIAMEWPWPDYIIPVPLSSMHLLGRGYNQSALLAASLGHLLQRPVLEVLGRYSGDYSQAGLLRQQRLALNSQCFALRPGFCDKLAGKNLLLVDDVITTGTTLTCCAEVLRKELPATMYAIAFCRAME